MRNETGITITAAPGAEHVRTGKEESIRYLGRLGADIIKVPVIVRNGEPMIDAGDDNPENLGEFIESLETMDAYAEISMGRLDDLDITAETIADKDMHNRVIISGISLENAERLTEEFSDMDFLVSLVPSEIEFKELYFKGYCDEVLDRVVNTGAKGITMNHSMLTRMFSERARERRIPINVHTVDNEKDIRHVLYLGVTGITTSNIRLLRSIIGAEKNRYIFA